VSDGKVSPRLQLQVVETHDHGPRDWLVALGYHAQPEPVFSWDSVPWSHRDPERMGLALWQEHLGFIEQRIGNEAGNGTDAVGVRVDGRVVMAHRHVAHPPDANRPSLRSFRLNADALAFFVLKPQHELTAHLFVARSSQNERVVGRWRRLWVVSDQR